MTALPQNPDEIDGPDAPAWRWTVEDGEALRQVDVFISGTAAGSDPGALASPIGDMVRTRGRNALERALARGEIPAAIIITTTGVTAVSRHSISEAVEGGSVFIHDPRDARFWVQAQVVRAGEPDEALVVDDPRVARGPEGAGKRARDVVILRVCEGEELRLPYADVRQSSSLL